MKYFSTKKILVILYFCILIALALVVLLFFAIKNKTAEKGAYEATARERSAELDATISLRTALQNTGSDIDKLATRIVPKDGAVAFIEMIEPLARDTGLSVTVASVTVESYSQSNDDFELLKLVLSTQGDWNATYRFISLLENLPYKIFIQSVNIEEQVLTEGNSSNTTWTTLSTFSVLKYK